MVQPGQYAVICTLFEICYLTLQIVLVQNASLPFNPSIIQSYTANYSNILQFLKTFDNTNGFITKLRQLILLKGQMKMTLVNKVDLNTNKRQL